MYIYSSDESRSRFASARRSSASALRARRSDFSTQSALDRPALMMSERIAPTLSGTASRNANSSKRPAARGAGRSSSLPSLALARTARSPNHQPIDFRKLWHDQLIWKRVYGFDLYRSSAFA